MMIFLLKCLDKYGREASVLFSCVDLKEIGSEYLNLLIYKYSKVFDFHFINSNLLTSIYEQENELLRKQLLYEKTQDERYKQMKNEFEQFKKEQIQIQQSQSAETGRKFNDLKNKLELNEKLHNEQTQMINELKTNNNKLEDQNKQLKDEIDKLKEELIKLKKEPINNERGNKSMGHILDAGQTEIVDFLKEKTGGFPLDNGNLVLKDGCGSTKEILQGIFRTSSHYRENAQSEDKTWIEYDFCQRKVNLSSYEIRTCNGDEGPKSWQILGSNDESNWTILSEKMNVMDTKGLLAISKYECNNKNFYRFIRFNILNSWHSTKYYVHFQYLKLFGSIQEPDST